METTSARHSGVVAATGLARIDAAAVSAFETTNFALGTRELELARLPPRMGGVGLRSLETHAPFAFIAAAASARLLQCALLSDEAPGRSPDAVDTVLSANPSALAAMAPAHPF